ncbi:putative transcriptional regulatory protein C530.05-like protein 15 [Colletotrichum chlorophyti]|uniref:Putative transcriptional regulatory protein C530.05-like protein 15 n=1 Tax=Colletotrichum chlorophyti TaxID=708187 RepID=A0A1Q8RPS6_9PEZI|nr:putative transcriptional regulatory protein C530.05-like protein 15 [Colletotrichum chlorophyti]
METSSHRRKACDLCFLKKIKCDMLKPKCSNCLLYKAECRTTTVRRRTAPAKERAQPPKQAAPEDSSKVADLESRLAKIEEQLRQALDANNRLANQTPAQPSSTTPDTAGLPSVDSCSGYSTESAELITSFSCSESPSEWVQEPEKLRLPPLDEIMPAIDGLFLRFNSAMPLFDQQNFMRMVSDWYSPSSQQSTAAWAAINIAIALSYRCAIKQPGSMDALVDDQKVLHHMRNVQSVVSELVTREEDLLGIQVLVGMVVLFQGTKDPKPASVLIGTAVRLAHRMHLHDKESQQYLPPDVARQRSRVFWMTYLLDKDISLKAKTPSFQLDADIDLPLPEADPEDGAGVMYAKNGRKFNFFRARVELSHIAGKVYDLLYSTRARKVSKHEAQLRVVRLEEMLEKWKRNVPFEFQLSAVAQHIDTQPAVHMLLLHHHYFVAMVMTHGIYSHDAEWVKSISLVSQMAVRGVNASSVSPGSPEDLPLPVGWRKCVELSRGCMKLFAESAKSDCAVWINSCAHFSGLIIVLANMVVFPEHEFLATDMALADQALHLFDTMLALTTNEAFHRLHAVVKELHRRATATVEKAVRRREERAAAAEGVMDPSLPFGTQFDDDVNFFGDPELASFDGPFGAGGVSGSTIHTGSERPDSLAGMEKELSRAAVTLGYSHC